MTVGPRKLYVVDMTILSLSNPRSVSVVGVIVDAVAYSGTTTFRASTPQIDVTRIVDVEWDEATTFELSFIPDDTSVLGEDERAVPLWIRPPDPRMFVSPILGLLGRRVIVHGTLADDVFDVVERVPGTPINRTTDRVLLADALVSSYNEESGEVFHLDVDVFHGGERGITDHEILVPGFVGRELLEQGTGLSIRLDAPQRPLEGIPMIVTECVDLDYLESTVEQLWDAPSVPAFPVANNVVRSLREHVDLASGDWVELTIGRGASDVPAFYYAHWSITYAQSTSTECSETHCDDADPETCVPTGMTAKRWDWGSPQMLPGELLVDPVQRPSILGGLFDQIEQRYDHVVMAVDHGRTFRHCTAEEARFLNPIYWHGTIADQPAPVFGLEPDVVRYGWPGAITQRFSELVHTGFNTLNPAFQYETLYPGIAASSALRGDAVGAGFELWRLNRAHRKRWLSFHDPDADRIARAKRNPLLRGWYQIRRVSYRTGVRSSSLQGPPLTEPALIKSNPTNAFRAQPVLQAVSRVAATLPAHYRYAAYSNAAIGLDASKNGNASWHLGSKAAVCSTFVWLAIQQINPAVAPVVELEAALPQQADLADGVVDGMVPFGRVPAERDGLYTYDVQTRKLARETLRNSLFQMVFAPIDVLLKNKSFALWLTSIGASIAEAAARAVGNDTQVRDIENQDPERRRDRAAANVANQITNLFIDDFVAPVGGLYPDQPERDVDSMGDSVGPEDMAELWDIKSIEQGPAGLPGPRRPHTVRLYGNSLPHGQRRVGYVDTPMYRRELSTGTAFISGYVVYESPEGLLRPVVGATVMLGLCPAGFSTDEPGLFRFPKAKSATTSLHASALIFEPDLGRHFEWRSDEVPITITPNHNQTGIQLELRSLPKRHRVHLNVKKCFVKDRAVFSSDFQDFASDKPNFVQIADVAYVPGGGSFSVVPLRKVFQPSRQVGSGLIIYLYASTLIVGRTAHVTLVAELVDEETDDIEDTKTHNLAIDLYGAAQSWTGRVGSDGLLGEWADFEFELVHTLVTY